MTASRARRVNAVCALALILAGCSGGGDQPKLSTDSIDSVLEATRRAGTMTSSGTAISPTGEKQGDVRGTVDAGASESDLHFPLLIAVAFSPTQVMPVHVLRDGATAYLERILLTGSPAEGSAPSSLFYREGEPKWLRLGVDDAMVRNGLLLYDPVRLVAALAAANATLGPPEEAEVGGVAAQRYPVEIDSPAVLSDVGLTAARIAIWADGEGRMVRLRVEARESTVDYTVGDFGGDSGIDLPDEGETMTTVPTTGGVAAGSLVPTGPYAPVRTGSTDGVAWGIERAPGRQGTTCWRLNSGTASVDASEAAARCIAPIFPGESPSAAIRFAVRPVGVGPLEALVVLFKGRLGAARLGFRDATWQDADYDAELDALVWVGSSGSEPLFLEIVLASGATVTCAPGMIMSMRDVAALDVGEAAEAAIQPWACE